MTNSENDHRRASAGGAESTGATPRVIVGSFDVNDRDSYSPGEVTPPNPNWPVFAISAVGILIVALYAFFGREQAKESLFSVTGWISTNLGWFYIVTATVAVIFVLVVAFSKSGSIRLGPDHSRPQFRLFSWSAMLFAAGIGVDLMFFAVAEPVTQYMAPPVGDGQSREAAEQAVV